ncbi:hypothetical protein [Olleya sp. UBA1516]|uniref:hypothetical protein n=1 Tax=Olleya sp. UBA1516 TaxID=1947013 RepID=UPI0025DDC658|nr:hypothetical protein [Olleya sp. UBA1516]|tara:strand:- start:135683 stop:138169 length:2487 start_codon:yes stop_codon:yes gene_type:complete
MSVIFKTKIEATLTNSTLNPNETKALVTTLELLNYQDTETYIQAKNSISNQSTTSVFTNVLAQKLYYHPEVYADQNQGLEFVASWFPLIDYGFYPEKKSSDLLVNFLKFSLSLLTSKTVKESLQTRVFNVIKLLVQSPSDASIPLSKFLLNTAFDTRDYLSSDFIIQQCLKHEILNGQYFVNQTNQDYTSHTFKINQTFVNHFYLGDWTQLISNIHHLLPIGKPYLPNAYNIIAHWFTDDLAQFYATNLDYAIQALQAIKERYAFIEDKSDALLNIKTNEGLYPLLHTLANKTWDSGDVILFKLNTKNLTQTQLDACYLRLLDWLTVNESSNFYTETFKDYAKPFLFDSTTKALPVAFIPFWFEKCHPKTGIETQKTVYNDLFLHTLTKNPKSKLPILRLDNSDFQITGTYLITTVFKIEDNLKEWLAPFETAGINDPLNQFLILMFYDAREALLTLYNEADCEVLQSFALALAHSATEASDTIKTKNLPLLVSILSSLCKTSGNYTRVNQIWALKNIDHVIKDQCNLFAQSHYINIKAPLKLNIIQSWYNFLGDYYYSVTTEAVWVSHMLKTQGLRTGIYFNSLKDDVTFFLNKSINRMLHFHKKSKQKQDSNSVFTTITTEIETYLADFLQELNPDKLNQQTTKYIYNYSIDKSYGFIDNTALNKTITSIYNFHFKEEATTNINILREQGLLTKIDAKDIPIDNTLITKALHNLEHYKTEATNNTKLLEVLSTKIVAFKSWLAQDTTGLQARFIQALYMTLLDTDLAPETPLEPYGNLCRQLFIQLAKDSNMAMTYALGLKAMANSGAYSDPLKTTLLQVVNDLNA